MENAAPSPDRPVIDAKTIDLLMDVVQSINGGIVNVRRYPAGSAVMEMVLKRGLEAIAALFAVRESVTFGDAEGKLIVDHAVMDDKIQKRGYVGSFLQILDQKNIRSLTLRRGLEADELVRVLDILGGTSDELAKIPNLGDHFKAHGIRHVAVDEKVFVALSKEQTVVDKAELDRLMESGGEIDVNRVQQGVFADYLLRHLKLPGFDPSSEEIRDLKRADFPKLAQRIAAALEAQAASSVARRDGKTFDDEGLPIAADEDPQVHQLMKTFERLSGALVKVPNPAVRAKLMTDLTRIITSFKSATLARVLSSRMGGEATKVNLKGYVLAQADAEKKTAVIDQLLDRYQRALEGLSPDDFTIKFADLRESERVLKALLQRQKQAQTPELSADAMQKLEQAVALVTRLSEEGGTPENLLLTKTKRLLAQPATFFTQPAVTGGLGDLVARLLGLDRPDLAKAVIEKLGAVLGESESGARRAALAAMSAVGNVLAGSRHPLLAGDLAAAVLARIAAETDSENLRAARALLGVVLAGLLAERKYDRLKDVLARLDDAQGAGATPTHATLVADTLRLLSADAGAVKVLVEDVQSLDETIAAGAARTVGALDADVVLPPLVDLLRTSEDRRIRKRCLTAIGKIGAAAVPSLRAALSAPAEATPWYLLRNLLSALGEVGGVAAIDDLVAHAGHEDSRVRRAVYQALMHVHDTKSARALEAGLADGDVGIRRMLITYFAARPHPGLVDRFLTMMAACEKDPDPSCLPLQADLCHALGRIGDARAVAPLLKIAKPGGLLGLIKKRDPKLVEAAVRALGDLKAPQAADALRKHAKDENRDLARAAQEALEKIPR
jgi:HEAT repeat protein